MKDSGPDSATDEVERLAALESYDILKVEPSPEFDEIVDLAARICDTPTGLVSFVMADEQIFKARKGLEAASTPRDVSFCAFAMTEPEVMVVPDATQDPRFARNALVTGQPGIRFYAGAPMVDSAGHALGSLCVIDYTPRPQGLTEVQARTLKVLARQVVNQLELRRALKLQHQAERTVQRALTASDYVGAWDWDVQADRVTSDERFARMYGVDAARAASGVPIAEFTRLIHPEDAASVGERIDRALADLGTFEAEYRLQLEDQVRWVSAKGQVYGDEDGRPSHFAGVAVDLTSRKTIEAELARAMDALAESEARFRVLADSMPQMVWSTLPDGFHDYYNARWYEFTGVPAGSTDGEGWNDMFHPEDQTRAWERWRRSLESGEPYEIEYRLRHHSGVYRWTLGRAVAQKNEAGEIVRWFGTCTDIDDLKRMEQSKELLSQELSHRIKNIFAVVSALVALSARQYPEAKAFATSFRTRINALARAHEFVRPHTESSRPTVGSMTLHAFLESLFRAYADADGQARVELTGEDAVFDDQAATSVALLFHELATNAAKYGALSETGGRVCLETHRDGDRFILTWTETGGPPVAGPPERSGFGTSLATLSVEGQLGGRLQREWRPDGLVVTADLPATALSRRRAALNVH